MPFDPTNYEDLLDAVDGLHAYDDGCVSSGIRDEGLRAKVLDYFLSLESKEKRVLLATMAYDRFLCPEALEQGYGLEDCKSFADWCDDQGILL